MSKVLNKHKDKIPPDAVYCGRGSPYGNPFVIGKDGSRDEVCDKFELEILPRLDVKSLRGKDLICFCAPLRCHCDAILKKANMATDETNNPFRFVNSILTTKEREDSKDYPVIFVNLALSQYLDCVLYVQQMNKRWGIPPARQYDYLFYSIPKGKRYGGKWAKKDKTQQEDIEFVANYYRCNYDIAKEYLKILPEHVLKELKAEMETGG